MSDPRKNCPSASGLQDLAACPGQFQAQQGLPEIRTEQDDAEAGYGNALHAALADRDVRLGLKPSGLPEEAEDLRMTCERICEQLLFMPSLDGISDLDHPWRDVNEARFWLLAKSRAEVFSPGTTPIFSGQIDRLYICGKVGLIVDFKSLFGHHERSDRNLQLRAYAVLAANEYDLETVHCAIVQPRVSRTPVVVTYDESALVTAEVELHEILAAAFAPSPPRVAGPQCRYCRAQFVCETAIAAREQVALIYPDRKAPIARETIARVLELKPAILSVIRAAEAQARALLKDDPAALPGWELRDGKQNREITDMQKLFERMAEVGVTQEEFQGICETTFTAIGKLLAKKPRPTKITTTGPKPMGLTEFERMVTDGCWIKKPASKVLARTGEAIEEGGE